MLHHNLGIFQILVLVCISASLREQLMGTNVYSNQVTYDNTLPVMKPNKVYLITY